MRLHPSGGPWSVEQGLEARKGHFSQLFRPQYRNTEPCILGTVYIGSWRRSGHIIPRELRVSHFNPSRNRKLLTALTHYRCNRPLPTHFPSVFGCCHRNTVALCLGLVCADAHACYTVVCSHHSVSHHFSSNGSHSVCI